MNATQDNNGPNPKGESIASVSQKVVRIPACENHAGLHYTLVKLDWVCPICGGPRGEPFRGLSYDGSLPLEVDRWDNACGHIDKYADVRRETRQPLVRNEQALDAFLRGFLTDNVKQAVAGSPLASGTDRLSTIDSDSCLTASPDVKANNKDESGEQS